MNRPAIHAFKWFALVCFFLSVALLSYALEEHVSGLLTTPGPFAARRQILKEHLITISITAIPTAMFGILYILCIHTIRSDELLRK